ncbi:SBBP repeat-containing protein [Vallitalea pronyensis]|uniref:SBBP repeat-containing protein n=1 Tax=Vallitalea pronyensis TaxID=1348613 RepID=A0A8J8ML86_9FIRM|nr:SBBP repeat-containing protein [Vallitalea pronyensis]QUI23467.1 SBBP repeat-containing protein [Vallitalea pronyensis]
MPIIYKEAEQKQDFHSFKKLSATEKDKILSRLNKIPLVFITNAGQIDSRVKYYAKRENFGFYFTSEEVVLSFVKGTANRSHNEHLNKSDINKDEAKKIGVTLVMQFIDANPDVEIKSKVRSTGRINYLKGNDPNKWYTDLATYEKVVYKELWTGIDLMFYGLNGQLKYEFVLHPGANSQDIRLSYKGADSITLDKEGNLLIQNELGVLMDECPVSYQEIEGRKVKIDSRFELKNHEDMTSTYGFDMKTDYNPDYPIIIDPGLVYSTYLGGNNSDFSFEFGFGIAIDNTGSAYVTGETNSLDFPTTPGAFQPVYGGGTGDAFVTKLNVDGSALIYSTYLGGSSRDLGNGIAVDDTGSAYVAGTTSSVDFPTSAGAFQPVFGGGTSDAFVTKLSDDGSAVIYSTYLGGNDSDIGDDVAIDSTGSAYVTGGTLSIDFPTTAGAFQTVFGGNSDAFVTKFNVDGTAPVYSTYLGGNSDDGGNAIAIDNMGSAYVTGATKSGNFPVTPGAFQPTFSGGDFDGFVTKLDIDGSALMYSTYLGGSDRDIGFAIAVDSTGSAYVTGQTRSLDFPIIAGAFQPIYSGGDFDVFVTKLNTTGTGLIYSTYLGGSGSDQGFGIAVDTNGSAYVTGETNSVDFPTTAAAFQPEIAGNFDAFVTKLNVDGSGLMYSTYLGGSNRDEGWAIAVNNIDTAYIIGRTLSVDFPTTPGAFQPTFAGGFSDAYISKINTNPPITPISPEISITNQHITAIVYEAGSNE